MCLLLTLGLRMWNWLIFANYMQFWHYFVCLGQMGRSCDLLCLLENSTPIKAFKRKVTKKQLYIFPDNISYLATKRPTLCKKRHSSDIFSFDNLKVITSQIKSDKPNFEVSAWLRMLEILRFFVLFGRCTYHCHDFKFEQWSHSLECYVLMSGSVFACGIRHGKIWSGKWSDPVARARWGHGCNNARAKAVARWGWRMADG